MALLILLGAVQAIDTQILFQWKYIDFNFTTQTQHQDYINNKYYQNVMPAGVKMNSKGQIFISIPRWNPNVPATFNKLFDSQSKQPLLTPFPSWDANSGLTNDTLHSILGFEIDLEDNIWVLDQGRINNQQAQAGSQKIVKYSPEGETLQTYPLDNVTSLTTSFLNDLVLDFQHGYIYVTDSGIPLVYGEPLKPAIIAVNMNNKTAYRLLQGHVSTMNDPSLWITINDGRVDQTQPMETGADGIALTCNKQTLMYTPLTSRVIYAVKVNDLLDNLNNSTFLSSKVIELGYKWSATDGMIAGRSGRVYIGALESNAIYRLSNDAFYSREILFDEDAFLVKNDTHLVWPDTLGFDDGREQLLVMSNQLNRFTQGQLNFSEINFRIWSIDVEDKSYLHDCSYDGAVVIVVGSVLLGIF